jgi:hypothetical protein
VCICSSSERPKSYVLFCCEFLRTEIATKYRQIQRIPYESTDPNVFSVERSTVYASGRVQIPAARFSDAWVSFFGLKSFVRITVFRRFGSSQGVRRNIRHMRKTLERCFLHRRHLAFFIRNPPIDQFVARFDHFVAFVVILIEMVLVGQPHARCHKAGTLILK